MKVSIEAHELTLRYTFTIATRSSNSRPNLALALEHEGIVGRGLAAPNPRYGESPESARAALETMTAVLEAHGLDHRRNALKHAFAAVPGDYAAKAALDMAVHDWFGKKHGLPLYRLWGLDPVDMPVTSMTIGIGDREETKTKTREAAGFHVLKIKLGGPDDRGMIEAIREVTQTPLRVDANEGWRDREQAAREVDWLAGQGVELVEQPMPADQWEDTAWLKSRSALPLIADEAFSGPQDLMRVSAGYHGVNVKLMKCGGIQAASDIIAAARALDLKIMLGCMVESGLGIAAAAHLAPLVDYADLDGNLLLTNDPYDGHPLEDGRIRLRNEPGLGVGLLSASV